MLQSLQKLAYNSLYSKIISVLLSDSFYLTSIYDHSIFEVPVLFISF